MARSAKININLHVGQRLRARRISLGLSQDDIGKGIGVASQQVQKYEKGTNAMNAKRLYEFGKLLKVPVAYFFEGLGVAASGGLSAWATGGSAKSASDRESLEVLKSFKRIKDYSLRKRIADLLRSMSLKDI